MVGRPPTTEATICLQAAALKSLQSRHIPKLYPAEVEGAINYLEAK